MKSDLTVKTTGLNGPSRALLGLLAIAAALLARQGAEAATNVVLWDTGAPFSQTTGAANGEAWKAVPSELFVFEADPPKAASDPGYYGREYSFQGDAVVENRSLTALFWSAAGRVVIYAKERAASPSGVAPGRAGLGRKILEIVPRPTKIPSGKMRRPEILRNAGDEVVLEVAFSAGGAADATAVFSFGKNELLEIKPGAGLKGISLVAPIDYGVVPGFVGDDLIFGPTDFTSADPLTLPAENVFLGLLKGESDELVMTWPKGRQQLRLRSALDSQGQRAVESVDFDTDGQSLYVAALSAPGLWHREELKPAYLEKEVALTWQRPFAAKWKTQLSEAGVRTTFAFREAKGQIWRGVPGSYNYPAWFEDEKAFYHLSKKVPPQGESIIYFLEGQNTPFTVTTPVDVMKATLGRAACEAILDVAGRKLRTHHRRGGDGVHRACTCGCTEAIQAVFESGQEVARKDDIKEALGDMNYFVQRHLERIDEYQRFAADLGRFLQAQPRATPELKAFLWSLEQIAQQIPQEYEVQRENLKSLDHAGELTRQTMALTGAKGTNNLAAYMELLKAWRAMGGAQDYVVAQCHTLTRKLFQEAGYGCVHDSQAVPAAQEVRARCRQVLRNPDGYEIWEDY